MMIEDDQQSKTVKVEQESEWKSLKRFGLFKILSVTFVILFVIGFTFFMTTRVTRIPKNVQAIIKTCENGNEQLKSVNAKFAQLNKFIDSVAKRDTDGSTFTSPDVLASYAEFKKPIPMVSCKNLIKE